MKKTIISALALLLIGTASAQEETKTPDTTRINMKNMEILVISPLPGAEGDTIDAEPDEDTRRKVEAHWAGLEFGPTILLNESMKHSFPNDPQWENDPGKSFSWNLNILEHKFPIYKNYIGISTGLGFNWTQIGLRQNILNMDNDSIWAIQDTVNSYSKNKLRAIYLTAPLMLEFCTQDEGDKGFYLAAGVIGGIRIGSSIKTKIETDDKAVKEKYKGTYGLNSFRLDAAVKLGYNDWGLFANYSLLPLFDTDKTATVYPLTFGLTLNF